MEKLSSKKDTKIVVEEFLKILKEIQDARGEIANLDIFGDTAIDVEIFPDTVNRLHDNIINLVCKRKDDRVFDVINNLIIGYLYETLNYEEVWGFFVKIMCNKPFTEEQATLFDRIRVL